MFKRRKKSKWFKLAMKHYRKGTLDEPYSTLFDYYIKVAQVVSKKYEGHYDYLDYARITDMFDITAEILRSILLPDLLQNFNLAADRFSSLGDDPNYETIERAFYELDCYANDNSEEIETVLREYVLEMNTRNILR